MSRLSEARTGRTVVYNNLGQTMRRPGQQWQKQMEQVNATTAKGIRAFPMCTPNRITDYFQMRNTQTFRGMAVWHPICLSSPEDQLKAYADPDVRKKLHERGGRVQERAGDRHLLHLVGLHGAADRGAARRTSSTRRYDPPARSPRRRARRSSTASSIWQSRRTSTPNGCMARIMSTMSAVAKILTYPNAVIGLSSVGWRACPVPERLRLFDAAALRMGAREKNYVARAGSAPALTFEMSASTFGLYDRGLLRPGLVADVVIIRPRYGKAAAA